MQNWIIYTFLYAFFTGLFKCAKKKSGEKNSIYEVLAGFTLIAFLTSLPLNKDVFSIDLASFFIIFAKSSFVIIAWLLGINAIFQMPLSLYSVINLSRIIFSITLSVLVLGETLTAPTFVGMLIVLLGLLLVNAPTKNNQEKETSLKAVIMLLLSCFFNSCSAMTDKIGTSYMTPDQLQFWFLLLLTIGYWIIIISRKKNINFKKIFSNPWIYVAGFSLTIGDKFLFCANASPDSVVSIMTLIKQLSVVEMILFGKIFLNEKHIARKLACSTLIVLGIMLTLI